MQGADDFRRFSICSNHHRGSYTSPALAAASYPFVDLPPGNTLRRKLFPSSKFYNRPLYFSETMKYNEVNDKLEFESRANDMILHNDICSINISIDTTYTVESTDNKPYDLVINPRHLKHSDMYKAFSIQIDLFSKTISIALIGDFYSYDKDCAVLEDKILTILQNDAIVQLNISDGTMIKFKEFDCFGCNYGIYRVQNGYIVYGEIEITMLDFNFNKKWSFSGKDIFVSMSEKKHLIYVRTQLSYMILEGIFMKLIFQES